MVIGSSIVNIKEAELMKSGSNCQTIEESKPHQHQRIHHFLPSVRHGLLTQPHSSHIQEESEVMGGNDTFYKNSTFFSLLFSFRRQLAHTLLVKENDALRFIVIKPIQFRSQATKCHCVSCDRKQIGWIPSQRQLTYLACDQTSPYSIVGWTGG